MLAQIINYISHFNLVIYLYHEAQEPDVTSHRASVRAGAMNGLQLLRTHAYIHTHKQDFPSFNSHSNSYLFQPQMTLPEKLGGYSKVAIEY